MRKFLIGVLLLSSCASEVKNNSTTAEANTAGSTFMPFFGKYVNREGNLFQSFQFKDSNRVEVEVVHGKFEEGKYTRDGNHIKVVMDGDATFDFTVKNDKELMSGHGIGEDPNFIYKKE